MPQQPLDDHRGGDYQTIAARRSVEVRVDSRIYCASCGRFTPVLLSLIFCSREIITCSDGGEVAVDWFSVEGDSDDTPTIIFLAGANSCYRITVSLDLECYR